MLAVLAELLTLGWFVVTEFRLAALNDGRLPLVGVIQTAGVAAGVVFLCIPLLVYFIWGVEILATDTSGLSLASTVGGRTLAGPHRSAWKDVSDIEIRVRMGQPVLAFRTRWGISLFGGGLDLATIESIRETMESFATAATPGKPDAISR